MGTVIEGVERPPAAVVSSKPAPRPGGESANREPGPNREYRPDIDGLRALAILSVVIFHAASFICPGGYTGVDIFFVISGYLIGGHIYSEILRNQFSWARFYQRRAKRILPALYVVLTAFTLLGALLLSPFEFSHYARSGIAATLSASNILLWHSSNYFAPNADSNVLLMTWSLGVEEQFYLVIPLLMVLLSRIRSRLIFPLIVAMAIASFALSALTLKQYPTADFYMLYSRAWELLAGVGLAVYEAQRARKGSDEPRRWSAMATVGGFAGLLLVCAPFWILRPSTPFPGGAALPSVAGSVLLIASRGGWVNRKLLALAPLVYIGRVSYSWYLWHWPLLALLRTLRGTTLPVSWGLCAIAISFGLAVLSYYFVERPFRATQLKPVPLLLRYAAVSLLVLAVLGAVWRTNGLPSRAGAVKGLDLEFMNLGHPCLVGDGASAPSNSPVCVGPADEGGAGTGGAGTGDELAVWGDSHAAALAPALRELAGKYGLTTIEYAKETCPPLLGVGRFYRENPKRAAECIAFNRSVFDKLAANPAVKVVVLHAFWEAPFNPLSDDGKLLRQGQDPAQRMSPDQELSLFADALRGTIIKLEAMHRRVVVVGDSPVFDIDPAWRIRTSEMPLRSRIVGMLLPGENPDPGYDVPSDNNGWQQKGRLTLKATSESIPGTSFWDMHSLFCSSGSDCIYRSGKASLYLDSNHLSLAGGLYGLRGFSLR